MQVGFDMTVSHWMWRVDSLDTGAGIRLGQWKPIIISIIVPLMLKRSLVLYIRTCNIVALNEIAIYIIGYAWSLFAIDIRI